jgi:hypothetical protein
MHELFYARLANEEYDIAQVEANTEVSLTVSAYSDNHSIANKQTRLSRRQLRHTLESEYQRSDGFDWFRLLASVRNVCGELFGRAASSIGEWPRSSAYYGLDIMFDSSSENRFYDPKLLEVNFMGDWDGPLHAVKLMKLLYYFKQILLTYFYFPSNM